MRKKGCSFADDAMFEAEVTENTKAHLLPPGLLYIYARCSTKKQDMSTKVQLDACSEVFSKLFEPMGYRFGGTYKDEGFSGDKNLHNRPQGRAMLARINPGDSVLTFKLDRISRQLGDWAKRVRAWKWTGIRYFSLDVSGGRDNICTTETWFQAALLMVFAEMERNKIRDRVRERLSYDRKLGLTCGVSLPYGYKNVKGFLTVDEFTYDKLLRMVDLRENQGKTWGQIAIHFHKEACADAGVRYTGSAFCPHRQQKKTFWRRYEAHKNRMAQQQSGYPAAT